MPSGYTQKARQHNKTRGQRVPLLRLKTRIKNLFWLLLAQIIIVFLYTVDHTGNVRFKKNEEFYADKTIQGIIPNIHPGKAIESTSSLSLFYIFSEAFAVKPAKSVRRKECVSEENNQLPPALIRRFTQFTIGLLCVGLQMRELISQISQNILYFVPEGGGHNFTIFVNRRHFR
jgi:hypothetical protein